MCVEELNDFEWFSHKLNGIETNIRFEAGSGCTIIYYNYKEYGEIFSCIDSKKDYIFDVDFTDFSSGYNENGVYDPHIILPQRFKPFMITIERTDNPNPSKKLKNYFRKKK